MNITKEMSDALNGLARRLTSISRMNNYKFTYKTFNGSCLPFICPNWKDVDFTADYCHIACVELQNKDKRYVGFNEDIAFEHYPYFTITGKRWDVIKEAFVGFYKEFYSERPQTDVVDLWLSKIHDNLYEFSFDSNIIRD